MNSLAEFRKYVWEIIVSLGGNEQAAYGRALAVIDASPGQDWATLDNVQKIMNDWRASTNSAAMFPGAGRTGLTLDRNGNGDPTTELRSIADVLGTPETLDEPWGDVFRSWASVQPSARIPGLRSSLEGLGNIFRQQALLQVPGAPWGGDIDPMYDEASLEDIQSNVFRRFLSPGGGKILRGTDLKNRLSMMAKALANPFAEGVDAGWEQIYGADPRAAFQAWSLPNIMNAPQFLKGRAQQLAREAEDRFFWRNKAAGTSQVGRFFNPDLNWWERAPGSARVATTDIPETLPS